MNIWLQLSEDDIKNVLAEHFKTTPNNIDFDFYSEEIGSYMQTVTVPHINITVKTESKQPEKLDMLAWIR